MSDRDEGQKLPVLHFIDIKKSTQKVLLLSLKLLSMFTSQVSELRYNLCPSTDSSEYYQQVLNTPFQ